MCGSQGKRGFARVERKHFPHLQEGGWIVPDTAFGIEGAEQRGLRRGLQRGLRKGKQLGIEQGIERGIERGIEQGRLETVKGFLLAGFDEEDICKAAQLSKQELAQIKRRLKN